MFDTETDEFLMDWPYNANKEFDRCDVNRDGKVDTEETEVCYERECLRSCTNEADINARTDRWCECRDVSFEVVLDQFDTNGDGLDI